MSRGYQAPLFTTTSWITSCCCYPCEMGTALGKFVSRRLDDTRLEDTRLEDTALELGRVFGIHIRDHFFFNRVVVCTSNISMLTRGVYCWWMLPTHTLQKRQTEQITLLAAAFYRPYWRQCWVLLHRLLFQFLRIFCSVGCETNLLRSLELRLRALVMQWLRCSGRAVWLR